MFQHPIYPTAESLDPFFFFFFACHSLATRTEPEPAQPGTPAGGIDELCRSGPASTVLFSPVQPSRVRLCLFLLLSSFFSLATSSSDLDSAQRPTTADPRIPTGQQEAHPFSGLPSHPEPLRQRAASFCTSSAGAWFSLQSQTRPSQPKPSQHVTRAVTTAYDLRV